ncbi:hypothetical protein RND71_015672 [Anisodus tanguticus]|uniref:C2H2-type domain-containing protein n=1 Tax=Anisodus tanguticus TaxID=243964 RepID=A0AAE1VKJ1_9SOLA|nr:hypothetical protein RND71_015672 [Anisodus tanguticus]
MKVMIENMVHLGLVALQVSVMDYDVEYDKKYLASWGMRMREIYKPKCGVHCPINSSTACRIDLHNSVSSACSKKSYRISTPLWLLQCPICDQIVRDFQNFMHHFQSHPIDQEEETYTVEGSSRQNVPLPRPSESMQHVRTMRNKRAKLQSSPLQPLFHPPSLTCNNCDNENQQLPPPLPPSPPSYLVCSLIGSDNGRGVLLNQQLPPPPPLPPLYHPTSFRGNNHGRGVQANQPKQIFNPQEGPMFKVQIQ